MADKQMVSPALRPRPLSPHLQIYRWPVTMATSIIHRVTGVGLAIGSLVLAWWLLAAALGQGAYGVFMSAAGFWLGQIVIAGLTLTLVYHLLNGIRHLVWDIGYGFEVRTATMTGIVVFALSVALTALVLAFGYWVRGDLVL